MTTPFIEQEILSQPDVLRRVLRESWAEISECVAPVKHRGVHFVGCGDMFFAARAVEWQARLSSSLDVRAWRSMDLRWCGARLGAEDLVVCASISGRTQRTIEAATAARKAGARVIGITDNADSAFAEAVDDVVLLRTSPTEALAKGVYPGYHHQIAQTKTYTAALLAELLVLRRAAGGFVAELERVPEEVERVLRVVDDAASESIVSSFDGRSNVVVVAAGPLLPTADYGAAKLLEYAISSRSQCIEEFNHLELFVSDDTTLAIVLVQDEVARRRALELLEPWEDVGLRSLVVGGDSEWPGQRTSIVNAGVPAPELAPFTFATALQLIAYHGARALGRDVDAWLGGVRTQLINDASQRTIRGPEIES
jgi:glucosamine--fructose-6-phosphate aminotransferase (isomerizing)